MRIVPFPSPESPTLPKCPDARPGLPRHFGYQHDSARLLDDDAGRDGGSGATLSVRKVVQCTPHNHHINLMHFSVSQMGTI